MAGLSMKVGGFGGVGSTSDSPNFGTTQSYDSITSQAFGPGSTVAAPSTAQTLTPSEPVGAAFTAGVVAVILLVCIRRSLPR
jgi:hypothetical protein